MQYVEGIPDVGMEEGLRFRGEDQRLGFRVSNFSTFLVRVPTQEKGSAAVFFLAASSSLGFLARNWRIGPRASHREVQNLGFHMV